MIVHLEDRPKSGHHRFIDGAFYWRYAALCGRMFYSDDLNNTITAPNTVPTCQGCIAAQIDKRK